MRRIKLLGALALLLAAACLLSSCSLGVQFLQAYMDARQTEEIPAQQTAPPARQTPPARETAPVNQPPAQETPQQTANPPAAPTAPPPEVTQPPYEPSEEPDYYFYGPGWFEALMGSKFYVPDGFVQQSSEGHLKGLGTHTYVFRKNELDMEIVVFACPLVSLPGSPEEEYEIVSSAADVTYKVAGNGWYVVSGYSNGGERIYYTRVDYDQEYYHSVSFYYPTVNADPCEEILLAFLRNYSTDNYNTY